MATFRERRHSIIGQESSENKVKASKADSFSVQNKHTQADTPKPYNHGSSPGRSHAYEDYGDFKDNWLADADESRAAREGLEWATEGGGNVVGQSDPADSFTPSNGMHSTGKDHVDVFARSVNFSGGVRQTGYWTSDAAPGIARASVKDNSLHLDVQDQGAGDTFRKRQSSRIGRKV